MAKTAINSVHSASYAQLTTLLTQIAGNIAFEKGNITSAYKALIGELGKTTGENPVDHTVVSYIAAKIAEVNGAASTLAGRVEANENAITLLNNNSETVGSVDYKIAQAFNDFATKVSDDNIVNTFKEMIDYVAAHGTEYSNLAALVGTIPTGATSTTVVGYAKEVADAAELAAKNAVIGTDSDTKESLTIKGLKKLIDEDEQVKEQALNDLDGRLDTVEGTGEGSIKKALQDAKDYADGLAGDYDAAGTAQGLINALTGSKEATSNGVTVKVETSKGEVSKVEVTAPDFANTYDAKGAASAVQGDTENTVKDLEDAINGFSYLTDDEMNTLKALFPTA